MKSASDFWNKNVEAVVLATVALILCVPLVYGLASHALAKDAQEPFVEKPDPARGPCVRDASAMRVSHMDLLKKTREDAVRHGIRGIVDLDRCRSCHVHRERFCDRCHQVVDVRIDCFDCHAWPATAPTPASRANP